MASVPVDLDSGVAPMVASPRRILIGGALAVLLGLGLRFVGSDALVIPRVVCLVVGFVLVLRGITLKMGEAERPDDRTVGLVALGSAVVLALAAMLGILPTGDPAFKVTAVVGAAGVVGVVLLCLLPTWGERRWLLAGGFVAAALLCFAFYQVTLVQERPLILLALGTLSDAALVGAALVVMSGPGLKERVPLAGYLIAGSAFALAANFACDPAWDSVRFLLAVLAAIGLAGAVLLLLPRPVRLGTILVLGVFHFVGILSAVFSVAPPNAPQSWLANYLWTVVYRPYLQFMYMNNAYHFYSPEPGPPTLLWFRLEYTEGDPLWVKIPNREDFPTLLQYQRRLALTESTNVNTNPPPRQFFDLAWRRRKPDQVWNPKMTIPVHPDIEPLHQFREPELYSKLMILAYSRFVATSPKYRSKAHPNAEVKAVKVYRVVHNILPANLLAEGIHPLDERFYTPYYMGEFHWGDKRDPVTGQLVVDENGGQVRDWQMARPDDPFLYWLIPILKEPKLAPGELFVPGKAYEWDVKDYLAVHAGDRNQP